MSLEIERKFLLERLPGDLPEGERIRLLDAMDPDEAAPLRRLLAYDENSAGGLMTPEPVVLQANTTVGEAEMRADNHQILMPMFVSTFSDNVKFDVEKTGLGFKTDVKINAKDMALPTTCKMQRPS